MPLTDGRTLTFLELLLQLKIKDKFIICMSRATKKMSLILSVGQVWNLFYRKVYIFPLDKLALSTLSFWEHFSAQNEWSYIPFLCMYFRSRKIEMYRYRINFILPSLVQTGNFSWNWTELALFSVYPATHPTTHPE